MLNHQINRSNWGAFFDDISCHVGDTPEYTTARVFTVRPADFEGEQEEVWRQLIGVTWEPREDTITVALDGLDHRIEKPWAVWSNEPVGRRVRKVIVMGPEGQRDEIVFLRVEDMEAMRDH